jgi:hypothetical protein
MKATPLVTKTRIPARLYFWMIWGAFLGFTTVLFGVWLRLKYLGWSQENQNPYSGPPTLMTCLFFAWFGMVFGAAIGMFAFIFRKRNSSQPRIVGPQN